MSGHFRSVEPGRHEVSGDVGWQLSSGLPLPEYRASVSSERPDDQKTTVFMGVHLAVADMARAMDFYRRAGLGVPDGADGDAHVEVVVGDGVHLAFSTPAVMAMYDAGWRGLTPSTGTVLQLGLSSRVAVDAMYEILTSAG